MSDPTNSSPPPDWRDMRRQEKWERRHDRNGGRPMMWGSGGSWVAGLILIALGAIFLAQNFGYPVPNNWWAIFILLPAIACFGAAWSMYQRNGNAFTPAVSSPLIGGLLLTALAAVFLMGIDVGKFWPVILIVLGLGALFGGGRWRQNRPPPV